MGKLVLDGPPWCGFVDADEAYLRGQARSVGSGALGGWAASTSGGFFVDPGARELEVRQELARMAPPPPVQPPTPRPARSRLPIRRHGEARLPTIRPQAR
jgi:hypothetical protein